MKEVPPPPFPVSFPPVQPSSTRRAVSTVRIKWNKTKSKLKRCRCQRLLSSLAVRASSRFIFSFFFFFLFFFFFGFRFFHSAFAFVIKWNLARRLAALNASQCAAIFISFNAHTNRLRGEVERRGGGVLWWHLPDNGKVHTNKCNKMIGMSRLSMSHGVSLCCPSSRLRSLSLSIPAQPEKEQPRQHSSWSRCRKGAGNKALIKFHLCAPSTPRSNSDSDSDGDSVRIGLG